MRRWLRWQQGSAVSAMVTSLTFGLPDPGRADAPAAPHIQPTTDDPFPPPRPVEAYVIGYRPEESWAVVRPWMLFDVPAWDGKAWDGNACEGNG